MSYECTVVTAYYDFPRKKHTTSCYKNWINNFLNNITSNVIIFTDNNSLCVLEEICKDKKNVKLAILELTEFHTYKFLSYWKKDYQRDHEKYHDPNLYMAWNEKTMFIKRAMDINPFNTEYYAWTDIGMVRDSKTIPYISNYPNPDIIQTLKKDKVYLLNICKFTQEDLQGTNATERFRFCDRIGGGVIFGHKDILQKWTVIYYDMIGTFMTNNLFAGKDQSILACLYLKYRENLIELVKPIKSPIDPWFYMMYYLGNKPIE